MEEPEKDGISLIRFLEGATSNAAGGILVSIVSAVTILAAGVLLRNIAPAIYITAGVLLLIVLVIWAKNRNGETTVVSVIVAVAIVYSARVITRNPPWCGVEPIRISIEQEQSGSIIPLESQQAIVSRHTVFLIQASTIAGGVPRLGLSCDWSHVGDGEILERSGCKLVFLTGEDESDDLIRVATNVFDCPQLEHYAFFMRPVDAE